MRGAAGADRLVELPGSVAERGALRGSEYRLSPVRSSYGDGPAVEDTAPVVTVASGRRSWARCEGGGTENGAPVLAGGTGTALAMEEGPGSRGDAPVVMIRDSVGSGLRGEGPGDGFPEPAPSFMTSRGDIAAPAVDSEAPDGDGVALVEEVERGLCGGSRPVEEGPPRRIGGGEEGRGVDVGVAEGMPVTNDGSCGTIPLCDMNGNARCVTGRVMA